MLLNPVLAHHLAHDAIQLHGPKDLLPEEEAVDPREEYARLSLEAMEASAALAPEMLQPESAERSLRQLRRQARRISRQPIPEGQPAPQLLGQIQHFLGQLQERSPHIQRWISPKRPTTSLLLPSLEGAYKELGQMVMSFSVLTPHQIAAADWEHLARQLAKHYSGLKLVTSTQFRLITELVSPMSHYLQRYEHEWGVDILEGVELMPEQLLRNAAQVPSDILVDQLPDAYLTTRDEDLGQLIHTFRNKMLNIQLENELLSRGGQVERISPPTPLPGRDAPLQQRVGAILEQLGWWTAYYHSRSLTQGH
jgi:hypothetical protein